MVVITARANKCPMYGCVRNLVNAALHANLKRSKPILIGCANFTGLAWVARNVVDTSNGWTIGACGTALIAISPGIAGMPALTKIAPSASVGCSIMTAYTYARAATWSGIATTFPLLNFVRTVALEPC